MSFDPTTGEMAPRTLWKAELSNYLPEGAKTTPTSLVLPQHGQEANVVGSLAVGHDPEAPWAVHYPVLDLDFQAHLQPSSTPGHHHLYIDYPVPAPAYFRLLRALQAAGLLQPGYVEASEERGFTAVRLPWVLK